MGYPCYINFSEVSVYAREVLRMKPASIQWFHRAVARIDQHVLAHFYAKEAEKEEARKKAGKNSS